MYHKYKLDGNNMNLSMNEDMIPGFNPSHPVKLKAFSNARRIFKLRFFKMEGTLFYYFFFKL